MEISVSKGSTSRIIYSDRAGTSLLFYPKMWLKWFSSERKIRLKTTLGDIVELYPEELKKIDLKLSLTDIGTVRKPKYRYFMVINKPRRAASKIPLLALSNKLQKRIGRTTIDVEREYWNRREKGYKYWEPRTNC